MNGWTDRLKTEIKEVRKERTKDDKEMHNNNIN